MDGVPQNMQGVGDLPDSNPSDPSQMPITMEDGGNEPYTFFHKGNPPAGVDTHVSAGMEQMQKDAELGGLENISPREQMNVDIMTKLGTDEDVRYALGKDFIDGEEVSIVKRFELGEPGENFNDIYNRPSEIPLSTVMEEKHTLMILSKEGLVVIASGNPYSLLQFEDYKDIYRNVLKRSNEDISYQTSKDPTFKISMLQHPIENGGGRAFYFPEGLACPDLREYLPGLYNDFKTISDNFKKAEEERNMVVSADDILNIMKGTDVPISSNQSTEHSSQPL